MQTLAMPERIYTHKDGIVEFNQLAVKIEMDSICNEEYYAWLDRRKADIAEHIPGAEIAEQEGARFAPPLNIAVYYDTADYQILPTGALLRTSCRIDTHAFCAFKQAEDEHSVRGDYRHVFEGEEKKTIQTAPTSAESVNIIKMLLGRSDIRHPGTCLKEYYGIDPTALTPSIRLDDYRYKFFVWLEKRDALRCSLDRFSVRNLRLPEADQEEKLVSEVELAIYPRITPEVARDERVLQLITFLAHSLCQDLGVRVTKEIKYQRSARALGIPNASDATLNATFERPSSSNGDA